MRRLARLTWVAVLSAALSVGIACQQGSTQGSRVEKALEDANVRNVNVDYDENGKVVHLRGKVDTTYDRDRADQIANSIVGTSGKVVNELTVEGVDSETADNMDSQIKDQLDQAVDGDANLKNENIDFRVNNGVVTISGEVKNAQAKQRVEQMVKGTTGVKDVANELTVSTERKSGDKPGTRRNPSGSAQ